MPQSLSIMRRLILLAGCGVLLGCQAQPEKPAASGTPIEIQLNWKPEAEHGGYYAALLHGYFAEEGLDVTLTPGGPGTPLMESLATNRVPFAVDNADKLLRARAEGADVVALFAPLQDSPRCIMVHKESGIKTLEDLAAAEGVTLAWNSAQPFAQYLLKKLDLSKLMMTKYAGSVGAFLQDQNYAQQAYNISEPFLAEEQGAHPVALMLSDIGFNTYTSLLLTNPKQLSDRPDLVRKVVRASQRGWQKYLTDPEPTNRRIAELNPEMTPDALAFGARELQRLCRPNLLPENEIGRMDLQRWQTLAQQLEEIQLIEPNPASAEAAFTTEFLPPK